MIIETTDNRLYAVTESGDPDLLHVWIGTRVRRAKIRGTYERHPRAARVELIRKAGCKIVSQFRLRDGSLPPAGWAVVDTSVGEDVA